MSRHLSNVEVTLSILNNTNSSSCLWQGLKLMGVFACAVAGRGRIPNIPVVRTPFSEPRYLGDDSPPLLCGR